MPLALAWFETRLQLYQPLLDLTDPTPNPNTRPCTSLPRMPLLPLSSKSLHCAALISCTQPATDSVNVGEDEGGQESEGMRIGERMK